MAHGHTQEEAMKEIKTALKLWVETAAEDGLEIPKPMLYVS